MPKSKLRKKHAGKLQARINDTKYKKAQYDKKMQEWIDKLKVQTMQNLGSEPVTVPDENVKIVTDEIR